MRAHGIIVKYQYTVRVWTESCWQRSDATVWNMEKKWMMTPYLDSSMYYFNLFCAHAILGPFQHDSKDFQFLFCIWWNDEPETRWNRIDKAPKQYRINRAEVSCLLFSVFSIFWTVVWWPHGYCPHLWTKWSGFEPWPGTLCCFLRKTLYFHSASLHPGVQYNWVLATLILG